MKWWGHMGIAESKTVSLLVGNDERHWACRTMRPGLWGVRRVYERVRQRVVSPVLRARLGIGLHPFGDHWFARGKPVHRYYVEQFLRAHAGDIHGHCLEFQEDSYTSRFGGAGMAQLDILHKERDSRAPQATLYADLTRDNDIPSAAFDCIICTYVLHSINDLPKFVQELHRILRPGGVLFVAVPDITVSYPEFPELWRFTPLGLTRLLETAFGPGNVQARGYGNSLTCAGEIRGLAVLDFSPAELEYHDPRFGLVTCARAVKGRVD